MRAFSTSRTQRRLALVCGALVAASVPAAVHAKTARADSKPQSVRVQIEGAGSVNVAGSLVIFGNLVGATSVVVQDDAGNGRVTIGSRPYRLKKGTERAFAGVNGRIYIEGKRLQVRFVSAPKLSLSVAANGRAQFVTGAGSYQMNGGPVQPWPATNVVVDLTSALAAARAAPPAVKSTVTPTTPPATTTQPVTNPPASTPAKTTTTAPTVTTTTTVKTTTSPSTSTTSKTGA